MYPSTELMSIVPAPDLVFVMLVTLIVHPPISALVVVNKPVPAVISVIPSIKFCL